MPTEIPKPPGWPLIGNALDLAEPESIAKLLARYGSIVKVSFGTSKPDRIFIGSVELLNEVCDEKRFVKKASSGGLVQVRNLTGDGLFTARDNEENWGLAHRILAPVLGPMMIGAMFDDMHDLACQLVMKWARLEQDTRIPVTDDFTRLTLDTLALCAMDTRFNSFYTETPHAFVEAMNTFLDECGNRMLRPTLVTDYIYRIQTRKFQDDIETMRHIANQVLERRKATTTRKRDLVDAMLYEKDPVTDKALPHENVINNMITFLIAGHETTSGLLSFIIYCLVKHPAAMKKAREEVLSVLGDAAMTPDMISKLPYISAVIRETLRLYPTAPGFTVEPKSPNPEDYPLHIGKEDYIIRKSEAISVSISTVHRDPTVYGNDAEQFRPERMIDVEFKKLPKNSWKPFGNGARGCIGRAFALQESMIVIALLLQNFDFELAHPDYRLAIRKTLTIKPKGLLIRANLRENLTPASLQLRLLGGKASVSRSGPEASPKCHKIDNPLENSAVKNILICYGSNTGTCQTLAHILSRDAVTHGFNAKVMPMDEVQPRDILRSTPVVIITASYEGQPPDNAIKFVRWLQGLTESPFAGIHHAVYGCGNREWVDTFQRIPALVDDAFIRCGSTPLVQRGNSDAVDGNIANEFDRWADNKLWPALKERYHAGLSARSRGSGGSCIKVIPSSRTCGLLLDSGSASIEEECVLTAPGEPPKRHLKIRLPPGMSYRAGDHLAILPANHDDTVRQVFNRFGLAHNTKMVTATGDEHSVYTYLRDCVELNQIATVKNIDIIVASLPDVDANAFLQKKQALVSKRMSVLQLLQHLPTATLEFAEYVAMLPPMCPRRYSISSSPLTSSDMCMLTYSVLEHKATLSNESSHIFHGTGSTYLAGLRPNDRLYVSVRPSPMAFHLPADPSIPIVMICAGSGLAPFLGFVQERAKLRLSGVKFAPALLFIGCRRPDRDMLYSTELLDLASSASVTRYYAFSKAPDRSEGCKYVQDRVWKERKVVVNILKLKDGEGKGKMYVCGESKVLDGVAVTMKRAYAEVEGWNGDEAEKWWEGLKANGEKFAGEVFD